LIPEIEKKKLEKNIDDGIGEIKYECKHISSLN